MLGEIVIGRGECCGGRKRKGTDAGMVEIRGRRVGCWWVDDVCTAVSPGGGKWEGEWWGHRARTSVLGETSSFPRTDIRYLHYVWTLHYLTLWLKSCIHG